MSAELPPAQARLPRTACLPRIVSRQVLDVSKDGDATISLDSSYPCSVILMLKVFPDVGMAPSEFRLVLISSSPVTGHH